MKILILIAFVAACSSKPGQLSDKAKNLEVYANKPQGCHVVGKVVGKDENGSMEMATNHALNQAADLGGTGMFVDQEVPNGKVRMVYATAYSCN